MSVLPVRHRGRHPLRAHPRDHREPGRRLDRAADPQPADGPRRPRRPLPVPGPGPGRAVHRAFRHSPGRPWHPGREDPAPQPARERLRRTIPAHRPDRDHRPDTHLRRTAPADDPDPGRGPLQRTAPPPQPPAPPNPARPASRRPLPWPHRDPGQERRPSSGTPQGCTAGGMQAGLGMRSTGRRGRARPGSRWFRIGWSSRVHVDPAQDKVGVEDQGGPASGGRWWHRR
jgi:hypothetical protein